MSTAHGDSRVTRHATNHRPGTGTKIDDFAIPQAMSVQNRADRRRFSRHVIPMQ